ncbi:MAG TPA: hypothetical protein VMR18_00420 [Candidatus Saccharimonadales bacterium]|nr:hypothetical protein [Candidatus Saccharimonadales bacterium]
MKKFVFRLRTTQSLIVVAALLLANFAFLPKTFAATLNHSTVMEIAGSGAPMIASANNELAIDFTTVGSGATTIAVNLGTFVTDGGTIATTSLTATSTGCTTYFPSATAALGTLTAAESGNIDTISGVTALSATTNYCAILSKATTVTNPSSAQVISVGLTVGSDSQTDAFDVLTSTGTPNSYTVTGTVAATFTLTLNNATDNFATNLSATAVTASPGVTATVATNALSGWFLWAEDTNAGLHSTQASANIPSVASGSNVNMGAGGDVGSADYALGVTTDYTTDYQYASGSHNYGGSLSSSAYSEIATSASPTASQAIPINELADISASTPPATDYTDTITIIGAGSF